MTGKRSKHKYDLLASSNTLKKQRINDWPVCMLAQKEDFVASPL